MYADWDTLEYLGSDGCGRDADAEMDSGKNKEGQSAKWDNPEIAGAASKKTTAFYLGAG